jgi:chemotaxis response regulator CheB
LRPSREEYQLAVEELERERQEHQEILRRAEGLELEQTQVSEVQQEAERLRQERQRLAEELEREREERVKVQRQTEQQEQARVRLEGELQRSQAELDSQKRAPAHKRSDESGASRSRSRRPLLVVGLLLGGLIAWFTSLVVALNVLGS